MLKKLGAVLLAGLVFFGWLLLSDDEDWEDGDWETSGEIQSEYGPIGHSGDPDETWAIYWYLCGSDLESDGGSATDDLYEMMEAELSPNVQMVVQTGGAWMWENDFVDSDRIQRYLYDSEGMSLVDEQRQANMGDPETLADFLSFCSRNYPADKTMVVFWNHGGGSVTGVSFDENYDYDSLTLEEMYYAFDAVYPLSQDRPPIDVIGFDTCLMATIDTAYTFADIAHYMVASEEWEPASGWSYTGFLEELSADPGMDGAKLCQSICDNYMEGVGWLSEDEATLSVVDLSRIDPLMEAYNKMGAECLSAALEDPGFFASFGREAEATENYGGNTRDLGYANMVDLGHLAENCAGLLPHSSRDVIRALEDCVLYQVKGAYRQNASGLSCYYSYNGDPDDFYGYLMQGCSDPFKYFFNYGFTGELPEDGMQYVFDLGYEEEQLPYIPDLEDDGREEYPLYLDDEGYVILALDPDIVNMLKGVYFQLAYLDYDRDRVVLLGRDNDIDADWDAGIFRDNFRGVWGALDGHLTYMEVSYECEDYAVYSVPILLNGQDYHLRVVYDYSDEEFYILGARKGFDDNGMADKNLVQLQPGDEISTVHYVGSLSEDDDLAGQIADTFTVTERTAFTEEYLPDGVYLLMFELVDARNNTAESQLVQFNVNGNYVDVHVLDS